MPDLTPDIERELEALDHALDGRRVAADLTELGELALLLREERPAPADGFARHLDQPRRARVPGGTRARRASGRRWFAWHGWMAPALGVAATGAGRRRARRGARRRRQRRQRRRRRAAA